MEGFTMTFVIPAATFDEVFDFLASSPSVEAIIDYEPPLTLQERFSELAEMNRNGVISQGEREELEEILRLNHFVNRIKLRARVKLGRS